jgi:hypothetical protein
VDQDEKVWINRLRRMADRQGYRLMRSRAADPRDRTYGGYQLVNLETGAVDCGWGKLGRGYAATTQEIEKFLNGEMEASGHNVGR